MTNSYTNMDLHTHSFYSDGVDDPITIAENANEFLQIFSLTDHDAIKGCKIIASLDKRPDFITGIEFSCRENDSDIITDNNIYLDSNPDSQKIFYSKKDLCCHILGYGYDLNNKGIIDITEDIHNARVEKVVKTFDFLISEMGLDFTEEEMNKIIDSNSPNHTSIAKLMVCKNMVSTEDEAFQKYIGHFKGKNSYITPAEAINVIKGAGGVPVLAHGVRGDGGSNLNYETVLDRVKRFKKYGLMGAECYYSDFTKEEHDTMMKIALGENLLVTAGSDYHGKIKKARLGDVGIVKPDSEMLKSFFENVTIL